MVCFKLKLSYKAKYSFIFQKKTNAVFFNKTVVEKVAHINLSIVLIFISGTIIVQLKKYKKTLVYIFEIYYIKKNEKWAKYLV